MMASTDRVQIPFAFSYPAGTLYASTAVSPYTGGTAFDAVEPVIGASVTINIRDPNNPGSVIGPATVYQGEGGTSTLSTIQTDSGGNVPGWVEPGSYQINVASVGSFAGATINWDAVRGDGVTRIAASQIGLPQLTNVNGATLIDTNNLASALVPTGTVFDHAGSSAPTGYHICDGSVQSQTGTFANLYAVIGSTYNTGGEGGGNFRLPNAQGRFTLGAGSGTGGYTNPGNTGGALGHTHSVPGLSVPALSIPSLTVNSHYHTLSSNGCADIALALASTGGSGGTFQIYNGGSSNVGVQYYTTWVGSGFFSTASPYPTTAPYNGVALGGTTDSDGTSTVANSTGTGTSGTGTSGANDPAFITFNKIIKL